MFAFVCTHANITYDVCNYVDNTYTIDIGYSDNNDDDTDDGDDADDVVSSQIPSHESAGLQRSRMHSII